MSLSTLWELFWIRREKSGSKRRPGFKVDSVIFLSKRSTSTCGFKWPTYSLFHFLVFFD